MATPAATCGQRGARATAGALLRTLAPDFLRSIGTLHLNGNLGMSSAPAHATPARSFHGSKSSPLSCTVASIAPSDPSTPTAAAAAAPPLAYELVEPPAGTPGAAEAPTAIILHGLMGSGRNWRTFAKSLATVTAAAGHPWRFALVDHIWHGKTNGELQHRAARNPSLPLRSYTGEEDTDDAHANEAVQLAAVAVAKVVQHIGHHHSSGGYPAAILGHSLGGKIALRYLKIAAATAGAAETGTRESAAVPLQTWSLDSVPTPLGPNDDPHDVDRVLHVIRALPRTFASRDALKTALAAEQGANQFSKDLVDWLGSNLVPKDPALGPTSPLTWVFDVDGASALYASYKRDDHSLDLMLNPPIGREVHVVRAAKSTRWPEDLVEQLRTRAEEGGTLRYHVLPDAGHWLHVDNPGGLRDIIAPELIRLSGLLQERRQ
uniref:AB hydrolase-1 domain-containing protein n=1 Tax=Mantoniella antarctica TaxID=81844 RepID=A0A7S0SIX9_9CHLO|mmetsp:Transcript_25192/g.63092  ORF Transcript_25192/g.63092 Transcript_25192/m.63092 type:complete len:434 (+) Transcript_25192:85-1386(+)